MGPVWLHHAVRISLLAVTFLLWAVTARRLRARKAGKAGMTQPACPGRKVPSCTCTGSCNKGHPVRHCLCTDCLSFAFAGGGAPPAGLGGAGGVSAPGGGGGGGGYASGNWVGGLASASGSFSGTFGAASTSAIRNALGLPGAARPGKARGPRGNHAGIEGFDGDSGYEFAVGSVRGLRQWKLPFDTELHNIMATDARPDPVLLWRPGSPPPLLIGAAGGTWKPGVNHAECKNYPGHAPPVEYDEEHKTACGCGFWAYWGLSDKDWHDELPVFGIVEGTGRTLIGSKGFRCEKAEIIALVPAFVIEVSVAPAASRPFSSSWQDFSAPQEVPGLSPQEAADRERELAESGQRALAWQAVCSDLLGQMYPQARVFETLRAMIALYPPGEVTQ